MTSQRIAFLDVDGTILEHGSLIAPSTVTAIRTARDNGHLVYLCTGRSEGDVHPDVRAIGFDGAITNGGAYATRGDEVIVANPMSRPAVDRLIAYFDAQGLHYFLQTHEQVFASPGIHALIEDFVRSRMAHRAEDVAQLGLTTEDLPEPSAAHYPDLREADLDRIAKTVFVSDRSDSLDLAQAELGDMFHVIPGSMPMPGGSNGEISMLGTTKGAAIIEVLDRLGLPAADSVGIGDSWNDVEMFEVCGVSVAMGNADPELQARADRVTTGVLDDGVWNAFVQLGLI